MVKLAVKPEDLPEEDREYWRRWSPIWEAIMNYAYDNVKKAEKGTALTRPEVKAILDASVALAMERINEPDILDALAETLWKYHLTTKKEPFTV